MALFDWFRRKPRSLPGHGDGAPDLDEPRCSHYMLAHYALRMTAHEDPFLFLGVLGSDKAQRFLSDLMDSVSEQCKDRDTRPDFDVGSLRVRTCRVGNYPCAVIEMPPPRAVAEAFFVAGVLLVNPSEGLPERSKLPFRYFTLEKGSTLDGKGRTVLCEWTDDGTHSNYGTGPPAEIAAFVGAVEKLLARA